MNITDKLAQQYAEKYSSAEDSILQKIADYTVKNHPQPQMLCGHLQGKFLEMISYMVQPARILEIGTFTGYSALCLVKGLKEGGVLHTIEISNREAAVARKFFSQTKYNGHIILHVGNALNVLDELNESWDLVFIDADKEGYINYFNRVLPKVRKNGFILADNALFHGEVLQDQISGKSAKAIQAFNDHILERTDVEKVLLPVRDGLFLIRKL